MKEAELFTKKPVTVSAIKWTGDNLAYVIYFTDGRMPLLGDGYAGMKWEEYKDLVERYGLKIFAIEGKMTADVGDYIIKGVKGEFYPCKPDIFKMTYQAAIAQKQAQQEPVAWLSEDCLGERYLGFDRPLDDYPMKPLYTRPDTAVLKQALEALCLPCARWNKQQTEIVNAAIAAIRKQLGATP
jgi:hypothetical protein